MDDFFMAAALSEARTALEEGEFPVGCVLVAAGNILARGRRRHSAGAMVNELDHAEIVALHSLPAPGVYTDLTAYTTMEPCLMCLGALLLTGAGRIVYAMEDVMGGAATLDRTVLPPLYRERIVEIVPHVQRDAALSLFAAFFRNPQNRYWQDSLLARYILGQASY